jgi:ADP-ribosylation factor-binding protein GGA
MRVKLQTPSTSELPAFNPILPLSAVTQVMLIANPTEVNCFTYSLSLILNILFNLKEKVKLRFKINYSTQDKLFNDFGDIDELRLSFDLI